MGEQLAVLSSSDGPSSQKHTPGAVQQSNKHVLISQQLEVNKFAYLYNQLIIKENSQNFHFDFCFVNTLFILTLTKVENHDQSM